MMPITKWTLRQRKWSTFWWALGIAALITLTLIFYPSIKNQTSQLDQSFNQIPQSAKSLITDTPDLFSPVGYLSSQLFYLMLPMLFSILAIGLGNSLISREENDGTLELLLARPVSRGKLVFNKALAGLVILAIIGAAALAVTVGVCKLVGINVGIANIAIATIYSVSLAGLFGAVAFFVASLGRTGRLASIGAAALIALLGYIISSLDTVVSWLKWPSKFFPFHYYQPGEILYGHHSWWPLVFFGLITLLLVVLSWLAFRRRDIG